MEEGHWVETDTDRKLDPLPKRVSETKMLSTQIGPKRDGATTPYIRDLVKKLTVA